jgi:hypothetical protein
VINRKTKKIILLDFKRTGDSGEGYFQDMWKVVDSEKKHTPIRTGLRALTVERVREVEVPRVAGQQSVREKEWMETLRIFGIGKEDGKKIISKRGHTLLDQHEKLFGSYWWYTCGSSSSPLQLLGTGISVRGSQSPGRLKCRGHRKGGGDPC